MEFNIKDLEAMVEKINKPSVIIYCSSSIADYLEEHWFEKRVKAQIRSLPWEDDRIFMMPAAELEKPIKLVIPEEQQRLRQYLGIEEATE